MEPPPHPSRSVVTSPTATRATRKLSRVRPPSSSPPPEPSTSAGAAEAGSSSTADTTTKKPPAKRARKAINCEPCRLNKLKCDRNRPCSSCELRGTVSQCYHDGRKQDVRAGQGPDPLTELNKIRKSLTSLENFIRYSNGLLSPELIEDSSPELVAEATNLATALLGSASRLNGSPLQDHQSLPGKTGPGARGRQAGGLYAGPTSTSSHLLSIDADDIDTPPTPSSMLPGEYDADVLRALPETHVVDALIDYYFAHCQWIYRHVWESTFRAQWIEYKAGRSTERLVLATCCGILALTIAYIPDVHTLKLSTIAKLGARPGEKLFALMQTTLTRYETDHGAGGGYSLEYAELLLLRGHYLLFATQGGEEIWAAKSRMMSVATAMGLHRDPSQWRMSAEVAERRRWLWWYILSFERWQSFLLGRPPSIANHHFDTQIPKPHDTLGNAAGLQMFGLAEIIGAIIDDALSLRPVSYSNVRKHDRALLRWFANLPPEWKMTDTQICNGLRSENMPVRRLTVQAVCILAAYYHIRFTLHRPYAARPPTPAGVGLGFGGSLASGSGTPGPGGETKLESAESSEIAASSAEHLIQLSLRCRREPSTAPERVFATDGHLAFHPFHVFSAAMFFSFQLIAAPTGPRAEQCRANIVHAKNAFRNMPTDTPGGRLAANGTMILDELTPLWEDAFVRMTPGPEKERLKSQVLAKVRRLTFPFHDPEAAADGAQGMGEDYTPNPTGMPGTVITNSGRIAQVPNSHARAASTRPTAVAFGSSGTLMPDMSVSGRTPVISASTWNYDPRPNSVDTGFAPLPMSGTDTSGMTWNQPLGGPPQPSMNTHVPSPASGPSQDTWMRPSSSAHSHYYPSAPGPGSSSMPPPPPPPPQVHGPPRLSISPQVYDSTPHAFAAPPSAGAYAQGVSVGGVSQEMPWGAGIGIDAGEWAGFIQTMAVPPMNPAMGGHPPQAATSQHQHMYGYAPQPTMTHSGHARNASGMDESL